MSETPRGIMGAEKLTQVFGNWPSFHDAEIVRFCLDREGQGEIPGPTAECVVHVFEITREVNAQGFLVLKNHSLITFRFLEVFDLELKEIAVQNMLWSLEIHDISVRQLEQVKYDVEFRSSVGLHATFQCFAIEIVSVQACNAEGEVE